MAGGKGHQVIPTLRRVTLLLLSAAFMTHPAWAQRLQYYETRSIVFSSESVAAQATQLYWKSRLVRQTQLTLIQRADATTAGLDPLFAAISTWLPLASSDAHDWVFVLRDPAGTGARATLRPAEQRPEMDLQPLEVDAVSTVQAAEHAGGASHVTFEELGGANKGWKFIIVKGQRMKEIAVNLGLSTRTLETHKYEMMQPAACTQRPLVRYPFDRRLVLD